MSITLYSQSGEAIAYIEDNGNIFTFEGHPVAYLNQEDIFSFTGSYLGWMQNGWIYDLYGFPTFFTNEAMGGPVKPIRQVQPVKGVKRICPVKGVRQVKPVRAVRSLNWSLNSNRNFFIS